KGFITAPSLAVFALPAGFALTVIHPWVLAGFAVAAVLALLAIAVTPRDGPRDHKNRPAVYSGPEDAVHPYVKLEKISSYRMIKPLVKAVNDMLAIADVSAFERYEVLIVFHRHGRNGSRFSFVVSPRHDRRHTLTSHESLAERGGWQLLAEGCGGISIYFDTDLKMPVLAAVYTKDPVDYEFIIDCLYRVLKRHFGKACADRTILQIEKQFFTQEDKKEQGNRDQVPLKDVIQVYRNRKNDRRQLSDDSRGRSLPAAETRSSPFEMRGRNIAVWPAPAWFRIEPFLEHNIEIRPNALVLMDAEPYHAWHLARRVQNFFKQRGGRLPYDIFITAGGWSSTDLPKISARVISSAREMSSCWSLVKDINGMLEARVLDRSWFSALPRESFHKDHGLVGIWFRQDGQKRFPLITYEHARDFGMTVLCQRRRVYKDILAEEVAKTQRLARIAAQDGMPFTARYDLHEFSRWGKGKELAPLLESTGGLYEQVRQASLANQVITEEDRGPIDPTIDINAGPVIYFNQSAGYFKRSQPDRRGFATIGTLAFIAGVTGAAILPGWIVIFPVWFKVIALGCGALIAGIMAVWSVKGAYQFFSGLFNSFVFWEGRNRRAIAPASDPYDRFDQNGMTPEGVIIGQSFGSAQYRSRLIARILKDNPPGSSILSIGAGRCELEMELQQNGFHVTAVERNEKSAGLAGKKGFEVIPIDIFDYDTAERFDLILLNESIGVFAPGKIIDKIRHFMTAGGQVVIITAAENQWAYENKFFYTMYTRDQILEALGSHGFIDMAVDEISVDSPADMEKDQDRTMLYISARAGTCDTDPGPAGAAVPGDLVDRDGNHRGRYAHCEQCYGLLRNKLFIAGRGVQAICKFIVIIGAALVLALFDNNVHLYMGDKIRIPGLIAGSILFLTAGIAYAAAYMKTHNEPSRNDRKDLFRTMRQNHMWVSLISWGGIRLFNKMNGRDYSVKDVAADPAKQADVIEFSAEELGLDVSFALMDLTAEAEAVSIANQINGASPVRPVYHRKHIDQRGYLFGDNFLFNEENLNALRLPDFKQHGRVRFYMETIRILKQRSQNAGRHVAYIIGPFTLATRLLGSEEVVYKMMLELDLFRMFLDYCIRVSRSEMEMMVDAGADAVVILEPQTALVGPEQFGQYIVPSNNVVAKTGQDKGAAVVFHGCADSTPFLEQMTGMSVDAFSIDEQVDLVHAYNVLTRKDVFIIGGINASQILSKSPADLEKEVRKILERFDGKERFVPGLSCEMPFDTTREQIESISRAVSSGSKGEVSGSKKKSARYHTEDRQGRKGFITAASLAVFALPAGFALTVIHPWVLAGFAVAAVLAVFTALDPDGASYRKEQERRDEAYLKFLLSQAGVDPDEFARQGSEQSPPEQDPMKQEERLAKYLQGELERQRRDEQEDDPVEPIALEPEKDIGESFEIRQSREGIDSGQLLAFKNLVQRWEAYKRKWTFRPVSAGHDKVVPLVLQQLLFQQAEEFVNSPFTSWQKVSLHQVGLLDILCAGDLTARNEYLIVTEKVRHGTSSRLTAWPLSRKGMVKPRIIRGDLGMRFEKMVFAYSSEKEKRDRKKGESRQSPRRGGFSTLLTMAATAAVPMAAALVLNPGLILGFAVMAVLGLIAFAATPRDGPREFLDPED
ncbi:MAG: uroporphyrinogen decarboxylase family protein, partial [Candidatus Omnitrophota bacterium]